MTQTTKLSPEAIRGLQDLGMILKSIVRRLESQGFQFEAGRLIAPTT